MMAVTVMMLVVPVIVSAALRSFGAPSGIPLTLVPSGRLRRLRRLGGGSMGVWENAKTITAPVPPPPRGSVRSLPVWGSWVSILCYCFAVSDLFA